MLKIDQEQAIEILKECIGIIQCNLTTFKVLKNLEGQTYIKDSG